MNVQGVMLLSKNSPYSSFKHLDGCARSIKGDIVNDELNCPHKLTLVSHHLELESYTYLMYSINDAR